MAKTETMQAWGARDEGGNLYIHLNEPYRCDTCWDSEGLGFMEINKDLFPEIQWSDEEPTRLTITMTINE